MGAGMNKQYLQLAGEPILAHTIRCFEAADTVDEICLVLPADEIDFCRQQVVFPHSFRKVHHFVAGGSERQHSVLNGLRALEGTASDSDVILIHDGVRPLLTEAIINEAIATARTNDGALVAVPVKDTIKRVEGGVVTGTPARETLWLAQTPQAFRYRIIRDAHERAAAEQFVGTDDASLVERLGGQVRIVSGDYRNIKITTPEDLLVAEAFLHHP
jgi:2-C-methyl-D-erythritol 4-phosphate cytidylyltransferase